MNIKKLKLDDEKFNQLNGVILDDGSFVLSFIPSTLRVRRENVCELFISLDSLENNIEFNVILEENSKLNIVVLVNGNNLECNLDFKVLHIGARSKSNFILKTLLSGNSNFKFSGTIGVEKNSHSVFSNLKHETLLLSGDSKVVTMPALEIFNDNVEVEHSASVGSFEEDKLFYLQSRGLKYDEAKVLLMDAFLLSDLKIFSDEFFKKIINES